MAHKTNAGFIDAGEGLKKIQSAAKIHCYLDIL
jgi:hypothetical protein